MKSPANAGARPIFKWIHTWIGLVAGLVISVVSLTGGIVVFRNEIELATSPRAANRAKSVGVDELLRQVAAARPGAKVRRVRFPAQPGDPVVVQTDTGGKQERLVCDASTGRVTGTLNTAMVDWLIDLHRNLLAGKTGRKAVGVVGILLFTLACSGLLLWLMGARQWRAWISVRPQGGTRRFHFELHRAMGLWSYGLLAVVSFMGIGLAYPDSFRSTLQSVTGSSAPAKAPKIAGSRSRVALPIDEYVRLGVAAMPDGTPTELRLPEGEKGPVDFRFHRAGDIASSGNHVYLEPSTGTVLAVSKLADQPVATRVFSVFAPIHYGEFGGSPIKALWLLLGIVPSVLFVTGLITWWRPKQRKPVKTVAEDLVLVEK